ncbi:MAG: hypothetical protein AABZ15_03670 [Nitrospirota bacterium]
MKKLIAILVLLGFLLPMPVRAQLIPEFDPVEKKLRTPMTLEEKMTEDFKKTGEPAKAGEKPGEGKSNWWKWALGALIVGGIAAAAGGGGGGGGGAAPPPTTGTVSGSW